MYPADHDGFDGWLSTLKSFYRDFFGEDSEEMRYLDTSGSYPSLTYYNQYEATQVREKHIDRVRKKVSQDIATLRTKGVYKKHVIQKEMPIKSNAYSHFSEAKMRGAILTVFLLGAGLTQLLHEMFNRYAGRPLTFGSSTVQGTSNNNTNAKTDSTEDKKTYLQTIVDTNKLKDSK